MNFAQPPSLSSDVSASSKFLDFVGGTDTTRKFRIYGGLEQYLVIGYQMTNDEWILTAVDFDEQHKYYYALFEKSDSIVNIKAKTDEIEVIDTHTETAGAPEATTTATAGQQSKSEAIHKFDEHVIDNSEPTQTQTSVKNLEKVLKSWLLIHIRLKKNLMNFSEFVRLITAIAPQISNMNDIRNIFSIFNPFNGKIQIKQLLNNAFLCRIVYHFFISDQNSKSQFVESSMQLANIFDSNVDAFDAFGVAMNNNGQQFVSPFDDNSNTNNSTVNSLTLAPQLFHPTNMEQLQQVWKPDSAMAAQTNTGWQMNVGMEEPVFIERSQRKL